MKIDSLALLAAILAAPAAAHHPASADPTDVERFDDGPLAGKGFPFSDSARAGGLLFLSGAIGEPGNGVLVEGGIEAESEQVMRNIAASLERRGLSMADVVKCTAFLADMAEWPVFNEVYKRHFEAPYPARSALGANGLALGARVELECIAAYPASKN